MCNVPLLVIFILIKQFLLRPELALVMGVACNRWSNSQSIQYSSWDKLMFSDNDAVLNATRLLWANPPPPPKPLQNSLPIYGVWQWNNESAACQEVVQIFPCWSTGHPWWWSEWSAEHIKDGCERGWIGGIDFGRTASYNHRFIPCTVVVYRDRSFCHNKGPFQNWINALLDSVVFDEG